jgi:hypothetical protein
MLDFYHVSDTGLGTSPKLHPRVPLRRGPGEDSKTPRICVASKIVSCLRMVGWNDWVDDFNVYRLVTRPDKAGIVDVPAGAVPDLGKTSRHHEVWLTKAAAFEWLGIVRMDRVALITGRPCFWWESKAIPFQAVHEGQMDDQQVQTHLAGVAAMAKIAAEMEAEVRAKGGKMASDFFAGR